MLVEAAINELMDDNDNGEYVLMSSKFEDVDYLLFSYLMMLAISTSENIPVALSSGSSASAVV